MTEAVAARRPGRPRRAEVDAAILTATQDLFIELGYDGLSVEGVAARAGVSKATIYRRYPSKVDLLLAAAADLGRSVKGPSPDTGSLRSDLQELGRAYRRLLESSATGRAIPAMIVARDRDPELARAHRSFIADRRQEAIDIVNRGVARGELAPDTDVDLVVDLVAGPICYRIMMNDDRIDDAYIDALVDAALRACSPAGPL